jgi:hypothetical protein
MATTKRNPGSTLYTAMAPSVGALLVAMTLGFLAGRVTTTATRAASTPARAMTPTEQVAPRAPWSMKGFRDDETARDTCVTPDCNG